jgi:hypothetical protein
MGVARLDAAQQDIRIGEHLPPFTIQAFTADRFIRQYWRVPRMALCPRPEGGSTFRGGQRLIHIRSGVPQQKSFHIGRHRQAVLLGMSEELDGKRLLFRVREGLEFFQQLRRFFAHNLNLFAAFPSYIKPTVQGGPLQVGTRRRRSPVLVEIMARRPLSLELLRLSNHPGAPLNCLLN